MANTTNSSKACTTGSPIINCKRYQSLFIKTGKLFDTIHTGRMFMPESKAGTIVFPGFDGGAEYGGPAVDPETGILYSNCNQMAWILKMFDIKSTQQPQTFAEAGPALYKTNCMSCHGPDRKGSGNYPSIV